MLKHEHLTLCLPILEKLYQDIDGMDLSRHARERLNSDDRSFTYGEVLFEEFAKMLEVAQPKSGEIFYDLGAGTGKAVFCAALLYDWQKCCGIDLLSELHQCSVSLLQECKALLSAQPDLQSLTWVDRIQFIEQDLMLADFSDADVIFTHATCFASELWEALTAKFRLLKQGARIIVVTKRLPEDAFELIREASQPFTWGTATVTIYQKS